MGRIKPDDLASPPAKGKPAAKKPTNKPAAAPSLPAKRRPLVRRQSWVVGVLAVVGVLWIGGTIVWRRVAPLIADNPRYLLRADGVTISELPEWIVGDVRGEVIQSAGLAGRLSILDPNFLTTVENAFALHPWVASVDRVEKRYPSAVFVELTYRRPIAAVETPEGATTQLLPIDAHGIHLPADDVPAIRRNYLPRITGVVGRPPTGQRWDDPRVAGAVDLAVRLGGQWETFNLVEIVPSARPEILGGRRYYVFDLVTREGTRIVWGAPPCEVAPGEDAFEVKLARLKQCVAQYASRDWVDWPAEVDIRRGVTVTPRTAKKAKDGSTDPVVAEKPLDADAVVK